MQKPVAVSLAPIIVKRVRKAGHGHHGGAWKVAFADFVTAMMAFFLLMWLLNSTNTEQRKSISSYFNDPLATTGHSGNGAGNPALNGGDGILDGRGPNAFTGQSEDELAVGRDEDTEQGPAVLDETALERQRMESMLKELREVIEAGQSLAAFADQLLFDITDEGLRIQIIDKENRAMFDTGAATLKPYAAVILGEITSVIARAPNKISISGHTDNMAYARPGNYGNWELSADRANAARRALLNAGLSEAQIGRVVGLGASEPLDVDRPAAPVNRRISIVVLRKASPAASTASTDGSHAVTSATSLPDADAPRQPGGRVRPAANLFETREQAR